MYKYKHRSGRGTIMAFFFILAIIALMLIVSLLSIEFFVKFMTMSRLQSAAQVGALTFARELVKLRDNEMGERNDNLLNFSTTNRARGCRAQNNYTDCTPLNPLMTVQGPQFSEYTNASRLLLFQIYNLKNGLNIEDSSQIQDLTQHQCYTTPNNMRFNSFGQAPASCVNTNQVISPITDLTWRFEADRYGEGICRRQADPAQSPNKDFCVEAILTGRLDPVFAGGLDFLQNIPFIGRGNFEVVARSVIMMPDYNIDTGTINDRQNRDQFLGSGTQNYSAEAIILEACSSHAITGKNSPCSN